jgi:Flp pilus assembly protein TadB
MIPWLLPALGLGIGLWLMLLGAMPARASLAEGMARLRLLPEPPPLATRRIAQPSALIRAGTPLAGALLRRSGGLGLRLLGGLVSPEDLAVVGQTPERHVAEKLASGLIGLALPLLLATVIGIAGGVLQTTIAVPLVIPLWLALVLGLGGFIAPDLVVRSNAVTRRREMVDDLTVFVQTVAMSLTANRGIEAALQDGSRAGDSWGFVQLRAALSEARIGQERPWDALGRLGSELGLDALEELAARVALAGQDGARIAESLQTFSETLRGRRLIRIEAEEHVASEQMAAVSVLPLVGFTLFLAAPAFLTLLK